MLYGDNAGIVSWSPRELERMLAAFFELFDSFSLVIPRTLSKFRGDNSARYPAQRVSVFMPSTANVRQGIRDNV